MVYTIIVLSIDFVDTKIEKLYSLVIQENNV